MEIPVIDFGPFLSGGKSDQLQVAHQVDQALSKFGFLYLTNHGIQQESIDKAFQQAREFYQLPLDTKLSIPSSNASHGYTAFMKECVRGQPSLKESFGIGNPGDPERGTQWPTEEALPGFKEIMLNFHQKCTILTQQFLSCLSLALSLPPTHSLTNYHKQSSFSLDLIKYPAVDAQTVLSKVQARMPAHSDLGVVTVLFQEDGLEIEAPGGLEVALVGSSKEGSSASYEATGTWIAVPPKRNAVVVNAGFLLKHWTNCRWKSAVHRVSVPPKVKALAEKVDCKDQVVVPERFSIPFFSLPDPDTVVEALPGTWDTERPRKWQPKNVREYLRRKREEVYVS